MTISIIFWDWKDADGSGEQVERFVVEVGSIVSAYYVNTPADDNRYLVVSDQRKTTKELSDAFRKWRRGEDY